MRLNSSRFSGGTEASPDGRGEGRPELSEPVGVGMLTPPLRALHGDQGAGGDQALEAPGSAPRARARGPGEGVAAEVQRVSAGAHAYVGDRPGDAEVGPGPPGAAGPAGEALPGRRVGGAAGSTTSA